MTESTKAKPAKTFSGYLPVAVLTLKDPFPVHNTVTFYENSTTYTWAIGDRRVWFQTDPRDDKSPLTSMKNNEQDVKWSLMGGDNIATITHVLWKPDPSSILYEYQNAVGEMLFSQTAEVTTPTTTATPAASVGSTSIIETPASTGTRGSTSTAAVSTTTGLGSETSSPNTGSKDNGLSAGAVAGVAIGCLLAGALIAGILAWFCLRRRKHAVTGRDSEASAVALMHREKGPAVKTSSLSSGSPIAPALENGLPQPLEDKAISGEVSKISNLIKNHVQSYYHSRAVSPGMIDYDDLQALGEKLPVSVGTLSTLLNNSATREIALRFCLAWVVTSRIQLNDSSNTTFLPPEVAKSIQSMNHVEQQSQVHSLLYSKWRALTAELLQSSYTRNPFSANDGRVRNIQAAATLLDSVLRPYADSRMDDGARSRNLEEILKRAAQFAFTLFSQPTGWDFDWQNEHGVKSGSLCIFPALVQTSDENGEPLNPPRPFSEAVNRRLDD